MLINNVLKRIGLEKGETKLNMDNKQYSYKVSSNNDALCIDTNTYTGKSLYEMYKECK